MKIIRNNIIPFKGFSAINLFGVLFVRNDAKITDTTLQHEEIHSRQMRELLWIGFYLWYVLEWIVRLFQCHFNNYVAYMSISFEREAYARQGEPYYLVNGVRKPYAWMRYL